MVGLEAREGIAKSNDMNFSKQGTLNEVLVFWLGRCLKEYGPGVERRVYGCLKWTSQDEMHTT